MSFEQHFCVFIWDTRKDLNIFSATKTLNVKILYKVLHCAHKIKIGLETELIDGSLSNKVN